MNKNNFLSIIAIIILFIVISVISFIIPVKLTGAFWISYSFSVLTFILILLQTIFSKKLKSFKKATIPFSLIYINVIYSLIQVVLLFITKFVSMPIWLSIILNLLILTIYILVWISIYYVGDNVNKIEEKVNKKVFYIKDLQTDVELLAEKENNKDIKNKLNELAEKIKYSDPMSNENLKEIENKLKAIIEELKESNKKEELINKAIDTLEERNKKAKILKE